MVTLAKVLMEGEEGRKGWLNFCPEMLRLVVSCLEMLVIDWLEESMRGV